MQNGKLSSDWSSINDSDDLLQRLRYLRYSSKHIILKSQIIWRIWPVVAPPYAMPVSSSKNVSLQ